MLSLQWVFVQKLHKDIQYNPNPEPLTSLLSSDWDWIWLTGKTYGEWGQWTTQELQEQWRKPSALSCIDLLHTQKPQFMKPKPEPTYFHIYILSMSIICSAGTKFKPNRTWRMLAAGLAGPEEDYGQCEEKRCPCNHPCHCHPSKLPPSKPVQKFHVQTHQYTDSTPGLQFG